MRHEPLSKTLPSTTRGMIQGKERLEIVAAQSEIKWPPYNTQKLLQIPT